MKLRSVCFAFFLCLIAATACAQKAYDAIYYHGKSGKYSFKLLYALGYIEASEMTVTIPTEKVQFTAQPDPQKIGTTADLKFYDHFSDGKLSNDSLVVQNLNIDAEKAPDKITGYYFFSKNKIYPFTLYRKKK